MLRPPLWSRDNIIASNAAGLGSIPSWVTFLVEVFSSTLRQMSGNLGHILQRISFGHHNHPETIFICLCTYIPSTIRRQAKRFKGTGSVKSRKAYRRRRVLTEETLDEVGERLEHTLQKSLKRLSQETGVSMSSVQRATTLLKLHIHIVNIYTFTQ